MFTEAKRKMGQTKAARVHQHKRGKKVGGGSLRHSFLLRLLKMSFHTINRAGVSKVKQLLVKRRLLSKKKGKKSNHSDQLRHDK